MNPRQDLREIFNAGLAASAPDEALEKYVKLIGDDLIVAGEKYPLGKGAIRVVGGGKGAAPMARALEKILGSRIAEGAVVVKYDHGLEQGTIRQLEASHPVPDEAGRKGAEICLRIARDSAPNDILICLLTGGASALLPAPAEGLTLRDLQDTTSALLASGADIEELNIIRRHLSRLAGGRLAKAANGATVVSLIVSDVVGDALEAIASGPTAPDASTYKDCLEIVKKYNLDAKLPPHALEILRKGAAGELEETPDANAPFFKRVKNVIIAGNAQAAQAAAVKARELGYETEVRAKPVIGDANVAAKTLIDRALEIQASLKTGDKPRALIAGGETTVTLKGRGMGGRNQQMALVAALELENRDGVYALFAGTDGTDGPTDAAGGFADGATIKNMGGKKSAEAFLDENDSYNALKKAGALLITGPTRSNVMDLEIILIYPAKSRA